METELYKAIRDDNLPLVQNLLNRGTPIDEALRIAGTFGRWNIIQDLLNRGANIDLALNYSSGKSDNLPIVQELINRGANVHAYNDNAFVEAVTSGSLNIAQYLLEHGANIHAQNDEALYASADIGYSDSVKYLLNIQPTTYTQDQIDEALTIATDKDIEMISSNLSRIEREEIHLVYLTIIQELLNFGADIKILSPEIQNRYEYLAPKILSRPWEYYFIEPLIEKINRNVIFIGDSGYSLKNFSSE
jgi:ankyrin repeat protein